MQMAIYMQTCKHRSSPFLLIWQCITKRKNKTPYLGGYIYI